MAIYRQRYVFISAQEICGAISGHNLRLYMETHELQEKILEAYYYAILYHAFGNEVKLFSLSVL